MHTDKHWLDIFDLYLFYFLLFLCGLEFLLDFFCLRYRSMVILFRISAISARMHDSEKSRRN
jgi:hypothetical protein